MLNGHRLLCVIPARAGSTRIPGKNTKMFHGKPIIQYSIDAAKRAEIFDRIIVSTDSPEAKAIAIDAGVVFHPRLSWMKNDDTGTQEVGRAALVMDRVATWEPEYSFVCVLYATAPMVSTLDILAGVKILMADPAYRFSMPIDGETGEDPGQFYWSDVNALLEREELKGETTFRMSINPARCKDINYPEDWAIAEAKYLLLQDRGHALL